MTKRYSRFWNGLSVHTRNYDSRWKSNSYFVRLAGPAQEELIGIVESFATVTFINNQHTDVVVAIVFYQPLVVRKTIYEGAQVVSQDLR